MAGAGGAPTVADVERACLIAYQNADPPRLADASAWLMQLQRSPHIWTLARELFASQYPVVQFFAATSVYAKVRADWSGMADDAQSATCTSVFALLQAYHGVAYVTNRLCLALAAIAVRSLSAGKWQSVLHDLLALSAQETLLGSVVEVMGNVPEETENTFLTGKQRQLIYAAVRRELPSFLALAERLLAAGALDVRTKVLAALAKWSRYGRDVDAAVAILAQPGLVAACLAQLPHPPLMRAAADFVVELQAALTAPEHLAPLLQRIIELRGLYAAARGAGNAELCREVGRVAAAYGEAHAADVAQGGEQGVALTALLLECLAHPAPATALASLDFWPALAKALPSPAARDLFRPAMAQAMRSMLQVCCYPAGFTDWAHAAEDEDEWERRRELVSDALPALLPVLGGAYLTLLQGAMGAASGQWIAQEVLLFGVWCACPAFDARPDLADDAALIAVVQHCCALAPHPLLHLTVYALLGALAPFLARHPVVAPGTVPALVAGLRDRQLSRAAAEALVEITARCSRVLYPQLDTLLQAYAANGSALRSEGRERLARALVQLIACGAEAAEAAAQLDQLLSPVLLVLAKLQPLVLAALAARPAAPQTAALLATLTHQLRLLSVCLRLPADASPVVAAAVAAALERSLPLLQALFSSYLAHAAVIEPLCDVLDSALTSAGRLAAPLLPALLPGLAAAFAMSRHTACLSPIAVAFRVCSSIPSPELHALLTRALGSVSEACYQAFAVNVHEQPRTVEAYFDLLCTARSAAPSLLYSPPLFALLLHLITVAQALTDHAAAKAVLDLASLLFDARESGALVAAQLAASAPAALSLTQALVGALAQGTCRSVAPKQAHVLYALLSAFPPALLAQAPHAVSAALAPLDLPFLDKAAATRALVAHLADPRRFTAFATTLAKVCVLENPPEMLNDFFTTPPSQ